MIDDNDVFSHFHRAFASEPPPGAATRLRAMLLERLDASAGRAQPRVRGRLRLSMRLAAGLILVVVAVLAAAGFLAVHRLTTGYVPSSPSPASYPLAGHGYNPAMMDPSTGWWMVMGKVLRTTDGGVSWRSVNPVHNGQESIFPMGSDGPTDAYFLDPTHAWVVVGSPWFTLFRTSDGGRNWESSLFKADFPLRSFDLYFLDPSHGWLVGTSDTGPVLFRTRDGGAHWAIVGPSFVGAGCDVPGIAFSSPNLGWIWDNCLNGDLDITSQTLLVTGDGGYHWSPAQLPLTAAGVACPPCQIEGPTSIDKQHTVLVVDGHLLMTSDGGDSWGVRTLPPNSPSSVNFVDAQHGWAFAKSGDPWLYRTDDGGLTWTPVVSKLLGDYSVSSLRLVYFVDPTNGFAISVASRVDLLKTMDGGQTWTFVTTLNPNKCVRPSPTNYCPP